MSVGVRQQRQIARALDRRRQLTLVLGLGARNTAGHDLACLGNILLQRIQIFVVDLGHALSGETAKLSASKKRDMAYSSVSVVSAAGSSEAAGASVVSAAARRASLSWRS